MNRIAILIGSPTNPYLKGVTHDLENMKNFLMSFNGGGWNNNEIFIPKLDPSLKDIAPYLESCKDYDFAFIYFSGHGFTNVNGEATVVLNQKENLLVSDLANRCNKQITIIDACRGYSEYSNFTGLSGIETINFDYTNLETAKNIFQNYTKSCPDGRILLYASQQGQNANDTEEGGYFSVNLLRSAKELSNTSQKLVCNISEIFNKTYPKIQNKHQPDIELTNYNALYLPFVLKSNIQLAAASNHITQKKSGATTEEIVGLALGTFAFIGVTVIVVSLLTGNKK